MKKQFFDKLFDMMQDDPNIYILFCGLGWPRIKEFISRFPARAYNCEASEQTALDIAVGLAYARRKPVVYTITPFLYRGFETLRTYIDHEKLPVKLIGVGRDMDYSLHDGFSHDAVDANDILCTLSNIEQYYPCNSGDLEDAMQEIASNKPIFISIPR